MGHWTMKTDIHAYLFGKTRKHGKGDWFYWMCECTEAFNREAWRKRHPGRFLRNGRKK